MAVVMIAVSFVPSVSVLGSKYECARVVKYALVVGKSGHLAQWLDLLCIVWTLSAFSQAHLLLYYMLFFLELVNRSLPFADMKLCLDYLHHLQLDSHLNPTELEVGLDAIVQEPKLLVVSKSKKA